MAKTPEKGGLASPAWGIRRDYPNQAGGAGQSLMNNVNNQGWRAGRAGKHMWRNLNGQDLKSQHRRKIRKKLKMISLDTRSLEMPLPL